VDTDCHEVERSVEASPRRVYELVSDVRPMGDWSPETYRCEWIDGNRAHVGVRFRAWKRHGRLRWRNMPVVTAADPGREFAFDRRVLGMSVVWSFTMEPEGTGTRVRESYQLARGTPRWLDRLARRLLASGDRHAELDDGMRRTLERIAATAEARS
jgi:Polyketide cyclase / dehydrase and lipid transport